MWERFSQWLRDLDPELADWESRIRVSDTDEGLKIGLSLVDIREVRWFLKTCGLLDLPPVIASLYQLDKKARARLQAYVNREYANHAIPYDSRKADRIIKRHLLEFAKDELDKGGD